MSPSFQRAILPCLLVLATVSFPNTALSQWRKLTSYSSGFYNEVFFFDNQHGWITSFNGTILRTANGGTTWQTASLPNAKSSPNRDICFVSSSTGFISGDDGIWKTTDGGATWSNISPTSPTIAGSTSCWFIDANNGVLGFGGCADSTVTFCATTNGGATWSSVTYTHSSPDVAVGGMGYTNGAYHAAGGSGKHWKSTDGGASWSYLPTGSGGWQEDLVTAAGNVFTASANGTSCGALGGGKILKSTNGGSAWASANFPSVVMWGVTMYSGTDGWACGDNGNAFKTTDGGATWTNTSCGMATADRIDDIHFTDATHGWAVGDGIYQFIPHYYLPIRDTINFGDVLVGTKRGDSLVAVKSIGTAGSIQTWRTTGADSAHFNLQSTVVPIAVPSCGSAGVLSSFQPKSEGVKIANVELTLLDGGPPISVVVKGRGVRPRIAAPATHKADTMVCNYRRYDTIPIRNMGSYPLRVDSAWFSDMRSGTFSIVRPLPPFSVPIGAVVGLVVQTDMNGTGQCGATLQLRNNDPDAGASPHQVTISGYRRKIVYEIDPDTVVTIPPAPLRTPSAICIHVANLGDGPQIIESVKPLNGSSAITLKNTVVNLQLQRSEYMMLCFEARATDTLPHERRFWVRTQPCGKDTFIVVKFKATNPYIVAPPERTLQLATCGAVATDSIVVRNAGNSDLLLRSARFSSPLSSFVLVNPTAWPVTVSARDSVVVRYQITPTSTQQRDTLTIQSNDSTLANGLLKIPCSATFSTPQTAASLVPTAQSEVCRSADTVWRAIAVRNRGNVPVNIVEVIQQPGNQLPFAVQISSRAIPPGTTDTVRIGLASTQAGSFNENFTIQYAECGLADSITLHLDVVETSVAWLQQSINLGATPVGVPASGVIELVNNGTTEVTIDSLYLSGAKFQIQGILLPLRLRAGEKRAITIQFVGDSTAGQVAASIVAITTSPCQQRVVGKVSVEVTLQELVLSTNQLSFGSVLPCNIAAAVDSITVRNHGTTVVRITQATFADPSSSFQMLNSPFPLDLPPGGAATVIVGMKPGPQGAITDRLLLLTEPALETQLSAQLTAQREMVGSSLRDQSGNVATEVRFVGVAPCNTNISQQLRLRNEGSVADTFSITSTSANFLVAPSNQVVLRPGEEQAVTIDATLPPNAITESLVIRSALCAGERRIPMTATLRLVAVDYPDSMRHQAVVGTSAEGNLTLANPSSDSVLIAEAFIENGPAFSVAFASPQVVAPNGSFPLPVRFLPDSVGVFTGTLRLILSKPCPDTLRIYLWGDGGSDRLDTVTIGIGHVMGRWGGEVRTPVIATNRSNRQIRADVGIQAGNHRLLQPRSLRFQHQNGDWPTVQIDTNSGGVILRGLSIKPSGGPIGDTVATIVWEVLRGDTVATPISIWGIPADERAVVATTNGAFFLENYCDAHGRLLRAAGLIDLKQNVPNPFSSTTVIEFEVPFNGQAELTVTDLLGNTLLQPMQGTQVAGRQQITIEAGDLPPGVYRYTLRVGLQTLSRWMILAR